MEFVSQLPTPVRIAAILAVAVAIHYAVKGVRSLAELALTPDRTARPAARSDAFAQEHPRLATVSGLAVSAITFVAYFVAIGLVLREFGVSLTKYLATASVLGLAIGFGSQGLVQDVVIGLTLLFSDAFDVGDVVEIPPNQIGRVEKVGLRFTTLVNFHDQRVYVPNRSINVVSRYRRGRVRAYVDIQVPEGVDEADVVNRVGQVAGGVARQHSSVVLDDPEVLGVREARPGGWRYLRVKMRLWPGQTSVVETTLRQRLLAALRRFDEDYQDWMISVTYRGS